MKQTASGTTVQHREPSLVTTSRGEMGKGQEGLTGAKGEDIHTYIIMTDMCSYTAETSITL